MTWTLPDPMLTTAVPAPDLPARSAAEPKWDGYRAQLARRGDTVLLRSRHGTDMTTAFPEISAAALAQLPEQTGLDGELVVREAGRLAFERLQQRLAHRGAGAARAATQWPAHYVVFDLLHLGDTDLASWSYARRRVALEGLFADAGLAAPFTLCPSTTDPATAREWLTWASAGVEGLCFKGLDEPYGAGARSWGKYKVRITADAIVGAVTGPVTAPRTLLLGRHDQAGRLRYTGRTTPLTRTVSADLGRLLTPAVGGPHPWTGRTFSAGWHTREPLDVALVRPELVVEVDVDVARDAAGRWRHPVRLHRLRPDVAADDVALFGNQS
ncbi:ATP-dependent DNA ligase [Streptomyces sp. NPDC094149]|uniref:ATP-dependent DNA ligase n=1 Tax=Streptomyces sp. NPDC094149 TaxID=3155079 RepID=UPI003321A5F5